MDRLFIILAFGLLLSCNSRIDREEAMKPDVIYDTVTITEEKVDTIYMEKPEANPIFYIQERLPKWFVKTQLLDGVRLNNGYEFDNRMNPLYLEADFNGDNNLDIAVPVKQMKTQKAGFAIIHGQTNDIHIIGAGTDVKNGLSDDMGYINVWKVNREKVNKPGLEEDTGNGEKGELILENPSLQIEKSEVGGGQIYWNGNEYAYFHQTC